MTSPDGINWTARQTAFDSGIWGAVTYGNGLFVAVADNLERVLTSSDGITWTLRTPLGNDDAWQAITYGNGLFVAVADSGDRVMTSSDGINWTARSAAGNNDAWQAITYGNGRFVAVANSGDRVMTSGVIETNPLAANNVFQGIQSFSTALNIGTTSNRASLTIQGIASSSDGLLSIASSTGTNLLTLTAAGNFGLGTSSPTSLLTVAGTTTLATTTLTDLTITRALRDTTGTAGTSGMVLQSTGTSTRWVATSTLGIGGGVSSFLGLTDTPSSFTANRIMFTNASGTALVDNNNFRYSSSSQFLTIGGDASISYGINLGGAGQIFGTNLDVTEDLVVLSPNNLNLVGGEDASSITLGSDGQLVIAAATSTNVLGTLNVLDTMILSGALEATATTTIMGRVGIGTTTFTTSSDQLTVAGNGRLIGRYAVGDTAISALPTDTYRTMFSIDETFVNDADFRASYLSGVESRVTLKAATTSTLLAATAIDAILTVPTTTTTAFQELTGNYNEMINGGTGLVQRAFANRMFATNASSGQAVSAGALLADSTNYGSTTYFYGVRSRPDNYGTTNWFDGLSLTSVNRGLVNSDFVGSYSLTQNFATVGEIYGSKILVDNFGTTTSAGGNIWGQLLTITNGATSTQGGITGLEIEGGHSGAGNLNSIWGLYVDTFTDTGAGAVGTVYGVYIEPQSVGTSSNYSIFARGANSRNYFGGSVAIGATFESSRLQINHDAAEVWDPLNENLANMSSYALGLRNNIGSGVGSSTGIAFTVTSNDTNVGGAIVFQRTGGNSRGSMGFYTKQSTTAGAAPSLVMLLSDAGNVGIGTSTPSSRLTVAGDTFIGGNLTATGTFAVFGTSTFSGNLIPNTTLALDIGTATNRFRNIWAETLNLGTSTWSIFNGANGRLAFSNGPLQTGTEALSILDNGNVGIGTTSPRELLEVFGGMRVGTTTAPQLYVNAGGGVAIGTTDATSSATGVLGRPSLRINNEGVTNRYAIQITNQGLGTSGILFGQDSRAMSIGNDWGGSQTTIALTNIGLAFQNNGNAFNSTNQTYVFENNSDDIALTVRGTAGQIEDMLQIRNGSNTVLSAFDANGGLRIGTTSSSSRLTVAGNSTFSGGVGIGTTPSTTVGTLSLMTSSYVGQQLLISNGLTSAVPTIPNTYAPTMVVRSSETTGSRPLFFGYQNGGSWGSYMNVGACGSFAQLCLNFGNGATDFAAFVSNGTNLAIGGVTGATGFSAADGDYTNVFFGNTGNVIFGNSGNVGIGTTSPNQRLTIFNNAADAAIEFSTISGANEKWTIGIDDSDGAKFKISSSSILGTNDRFTIDGLGNIGIGTTTPSYRLDISTATDFNHLSLSGTGLPMIKFRNPNYNAGDGGEFWQNTDGTLRLNVNSSVGIAMTTAGHLLPNSNDTQNLGSTVARWSCLYYDATNLGTCTSDERLKSNIQDLTFGDSPLEQLNGLQMRTFEWNDAPGIYSYGFIAQEVAAVAPMLVEEGEDGYLRVRYGYMAYLQLAATQQFKRELDELFATGTTSATSSFKRLFGQSTPTVWEKITDLARNFVDGVLTVAGLKTREICVVDEGGQTCLDRSQLNALLQNAQTPTSATEAPTPDETSSSGDVSVTPVSDNGQVSDEGTTNDANQVSVPVPPSVTDQASSEGELGDVLGDTTTP